MSNLHAFLLGLPVGFLVMFVITRAPKWVFTGRKVLAADKLAFDLIERYDNVTPQEILAAWKATQLVRDAGKKARETLKQGKWST